jgi:hypothetical protein
MEILYSVLARCKTVGVWVIQQYVDATKDVLLAARHFPDVPKNRPGVQRFANFGRSANIRRSITTCCMQAGNIVVRWFRLAYQTAAAMGLFSGFPPPAASLFGKIAPSMWPPLHPMGLAQIHYPKAI